MGGPYMVEIVLCTVTRRGRKMRKGMNKGLKGNMRNDGPMFQFVPPDDTIKITLDLSDNGPVFSALDEMMMKMVDDPGGGGGSSKSSEAKKALKNLLKSGIPGIEGMFAGRQDGGGDGGQKKIGKIGKGKQKGFHKMPESSRGKFMKAVFGKDNDTIEATTAAALLAATYSNGDPQIGENIAQLLMPEIGSNVDQNMMAALMSSSSMINAGASTEEVMKCMSMELSKSQMPEEDIMQKTKVILKAFGKKDVKDSLIDLSLVSRQSNSALKKANISPKEMAKIKLVQKVLQGCGVEPNNLAKMMIVESQLIRKGAHTKDVADVLLTLAGDPQKAKSKIDMAKIIKEDRLKRTDVKSCVRLCQALDNENEPSWKEVKQMKDILGGASTGSAEAMGLNLQRAIKASGLTKVDVTNILQAQKAISAIDPDGTLVAKLLIIQKHIAENGVPANEIARVLADGVESTELSEYYMALAVQGMDEDLKGKHIETFANIYEQLGLKSNVLKDIIDHIDNNLIQVRCSLDDVAENHVNAAMTRGEREITITKSLAEVLHNTGASPEIIASTMFNAIHNNMNNVDHLDIIKNIGKAMHDQDVKADDLLTALKLLQSESEEVMIEQDTMKKAMESILKDMQMFPDEIRNRVEAIYPFKKPLKKTIHELSDDENNNTDEPNDKNIPGVSMGSDSDEIGDDEDRIYQTMSESRRGSYIGGAGIGKRPSLTVVHKKNETSEDNSTPDSDTEDAVDNSQPPRDQAFITINESTLSHLKKIAEEDESSEMKFVGCELNTQVIPTPQHTSLEKEAERVDTKSLINEVDKGVNALPFRLKENNHTPIIDDVSQNEKADNGKRRKISPSEFIVQLRKSNIGMNVANDDFCVQEGNLTSEEKEISNKLAEMFAKKTLGVTHNPCSLEKTEMEAMAQNISPRSFNLIAESALKEGAGVHQMMELGEMSGASHKQLSEMLRFAVVNGGKNVLDDEYCSMEGADDQLLECLKDNMGSKPVMLCQADLLAGATSDQIDNQMNKIGVRKADMAQIRRIVRKQTQQADARKTDPMAELANRPRKTISLDNLDAIRFRVGNQVPYDFDLLSDCKKVVNNYSGRFLPPSCAKIYVNVDTSESTYKAPTLSQEDINKLLSVFNNEGLLTCSDGIAKFRTADESYENHIQDFSQVLKRAINDMKKKEPSEYTEESQVAMRDLLTSNAASISTLRDHLEKLRKDAEQSSHGEDRKQRSCTDLSVGNLNLLEDFLKQSSNREESGPISAFHYFAPTTLLSTLLRNNFSISSNCSSSPPSCSFDSNNEQQSFSTNRLAPYYIPDDELNFYKTVAPFNSYNPSGSTSILRPSVRRRYLLRKQREEETERRKRRHFRSTPPPSSNTMTTTAATTRNDDLQNAIEIESCNSEQVKKRLQCEERDDATTSTTFNSQSAKHERHRETRSVERSVLDEGKKDALPLIIHSSGGFRRCFRIVHFNNEEGFQSPSEKLP